MQPSWQDKSINCPMAALAKWTGFSFRKQYWFGLATLAEGTLVMFSKPFWQFCYQLTKTVKIHTYSNLEIGLKLFLYYWSQHVIYFQSKNHYFNTKMAQMNQINFISCRTKNFFKKYWNASLASESLLQKHK